MSHEVLVSSGSWKHFEGLIPQHTLYLHFGKAGDLPCERWGLTVQEQRNAGGAAPTIQLKLSLYSSSQAQGIPAVGNFGYPSAGAMEEFSQGYGTCGYIYELPELLLRFIETASGVTLPRHDPKASRRALA